MFRIVETKPWRVEHRDMFLGLGTWRSGASDYRRVSGEFWAHRIVRDVVRSVFGFHRHTTEVYKGQVTAENADKMCRALNGEQEPGGYIDLRCCGCNTVLRSIAYPRTLAWAEVPPCATCCAKPEVEFSASADGKLWTPCDAFGKSVERRTGADRRKPAKNTKPKTRKATR